MTNKPDLPPWKPLNAGNFMALVGPLLSVRADDGSFIYGLQTGDQHKNAIGIVHGGVITSLLDQAIAMVTWTAADRKPTVTVQMDVRFMNAAKAGDLIEARANVHHTTRSLMFIDATVNCGKKVLSTASAVMKISNNPTS